MIWPWLIGGAIVLIAAATGENKSQTSASYYRAASRQKSSEQKVKVMLQTHHENVSKHQQQLLKKQNRLLADKNWQDRNNLKTLKQRLANTTSQNEKDLLKQQIKFYKSEIRKNYSQIANNRKLLTT
mgnify:CR=1 FL=1